MRTDNLLESAMRECGVIFLLAISRRLIYNEKKGGLHGIPETTRPAARLAT